MDTTIAKLLLLALCAHAAAADDIRSAAEDLEKPSHTKGIKVYRRQQEAGTYSCSSCMEVTNSSARRCQQAIPSDNSWSITCSVNNQPGVNCNGCSSCSADGCTGCASYDCKGVLDGLLLMLLVLVVVFVYSAYRRCQYLLLMLTRAYAVFRCIQRLTRGRTPSRRYVSGAASSNLAGGYVPAPGPGSLDHYGVQTWPEAAAYSTPASGLLAAQQLLQALLVQQPSQGTPPGTTTVTS